MTNGDGIHIKRRQPGSKVLTVGDTAVKLVARPADRKTLLLQQLANAADQQHFMMLIVATISAALDGF